MPLELDEPAPERPTERTSARARALVLPGDDPSAFGPPRTGDERERRLKRRHEIIAAFDAIGWPAREIAAFFGITTGAIAYVRKDERYRRACDALAERAKARIVDGAFDVVAAIAEDRARNFGFLRAVRDDEDARMDHRLKVGLEFFERQAPKRREGESDRATYINFDMREIREMREALAADGVEVEPPADESVTEDAERSER